jgi:hypothetical protein
MGRRWKFFSEQVTDLVHENKKARDEKVLVFGTEEFGTGMPTA